jgi:hypothetical protein
MFNRIALRLAVFEALCPHAVAATGPWPTIAGNRVFDSRQDPVDLLDPEEQRPLIMIYTEEHEQSNFGRAARFGTDENMVQLVIETMIATRGTVEVAAADGSAQSVGTLEVPVADWRHEMLLDTLEGLIIRALDPKGIPPASWEAFRRVAVELRGITSVPLRSADKSVRLAARTLTLRLQVQPDAWPADPALTGWARLPSPLSTITDLFAPGSLAADVFDDLAGLVPTPQNPAVNASVHLFANVDRGAPPLTESAADIHSNPL